MDIPKYLGLFRDINPNLGLGISNRAFIIKYYNKVKLLAKRNCTKAKTQREKSGWLAGIICMQTPHYVHSFLAID